MPIPIGVVDRVDGVNLDDLTPAGGSAIYVPDNDGNIILQITNSGGSASWVDVVPAATVAGFSLAPMRLTVAAGESIWYGPLPPFVFNRDDGSVLIYPADGGIGVVGLQI